jgi:hypothetical protein
VLSQCVPPIHTGTWQIYEIPGDQHRGFPLGFRQNAAYYREEEKSKLQRMTGGLDGECHFSSGATASNSMICFV